MIRCRHESRFARGQSISFWLALSTAATGINRPLRGALSRFGVVVYAADTSSYTTSAALAWLTHHRCITRRSEKPSALNLHAPFFLPTATHAGTCVRRRRLRHLRFSSSDNMDDSTGSSAPYGWSPLPPREGNESNRQRRRRRQVVNLALAAEENNQESWEAGNSSSSPPSSTQRADDTRESNRGRQSFGDRGSNGKGGPSSDGGGSNDAPLKRKYRPGHNSYLKVVLDDDMLDRLHGAVLRIRDRVHQLDVATPVAQGSMEEIALSSSNASNDNGATCSDDKTAGANPPPMVSVKPRSRGSLHMTLFFGGEVLGQLSKEELEEFHRDVSAVLLSRQEPPMFVQHGTMDGAADDDPPPRRETFMNDDATTPVAETVPTHSLIMQGKPDASQCFRLVDLRTFPPRRNNLIVAAFEAPEAWHDVHDDLRRAALQSSSSDIRSVAAASSGGPRWIAHVTLANLVVSKRKSSRGQQQQSQQQPPPQQHLAHVSSWKSQLQELLEEETRKLSGGAGAGAGDDQSLAVGRRVAMGGPVPDQVELDWTFRAESAIASKR
jgi:hypothetical protein